MFDPPADPFGDERTCRICDDFLEYNPLTRQWECTNDHDAEEKLVVYEDTLDDVVEEEFPY